MKFSTCLHNPVLCSQHLQFFRSFFLYYLILSFLSTKRKGKKKRAEWIFIIKSEKGWVDKEQKNHSIIFVQQKGFIIWSRKRKNRVDDVNIQKDICFWFFFPLTIPVLVFITFCTHLHIRFDQDDCWTKFIEFESTENEKVWYT